MILAPIVAPVLFVVVRETAPRRVVAPRVSESVIAPFPAIKVRGWAPAEDPSILFPKTILAF